MDRCDMQSFYTLTIENLANTDKGDSLITNCDLAADSTSGKCIQQKSSGGLRILGNKFLDCQDSVYIPWTNGLSGGPIIQGNSFENMTRRGIFIVGDSESVMNGVTIQDNWINGAVDSIFIDNSAVVKRALISGNNILGGATSIGINIGALTDEFLVSNNLMDGNGASSSYGVFARDGASGHIGPNRMTGFSTNIINQSSGVTSSAQW
jgi:hypothetical protein